MPKFLLTKILILTSICSIHNINTSIKDYYKNIVSKGQDLFTRRKSTIFSKKYNINSINSINSIYISNYNGNINIKTWPSQKIVIEAVKKAIPKYLDKIQIKTDHKGQTLNIETLSKEKDIIVDYNLVLPENININISSNTGNIKIKNIAGNIDTTIFQKGNINISNSEKTIIAKTNQGNIKVKQKSLMRPDTLFLNSSKGSVCLYLPTNTTADLQLNTQKGQITTKQEVTIYPKKAALNKKYWSQVKKEVSGKLKKGGSSIVIEVKNGNINLDEY